ITPESRCRSSPSASDASPAPSAAAKPLPTLALPSQNTSTWSRLLPVLPSIDPLFHSVIAANEGLRQHTGFCLGELPGRRLHEIARLTDEGAADASVQRQFRASHSFNNHASRIR